MRNLRFYQTLSVGGKLQLIGLVSLAVSIVLSTLWLLANDYRMSSALVRQAIDTETRIVADNVAVALHFDDEEAATETLAALRASPSVRGARLLAVDGRLFADYQAVAQAEQAGEGHELAVPVRLNGKALGKLFVSYDLGDFTRQWQRKVVVAVLVALSCLLLAFLMLNRLLADIVSPLARLSALMESVAASQDYTQRSGVAREDELGLLASRLDEMLARIDAYRRDELLQAEAKLDASEQRYNALVEQVPVGVLQLDEGARLVFANRMFWRLLGLEQPSAAHVDSLGFVHADSRAELVRQVEAAQAGRIERSREIRLHDRAGAEAWVSVSVRPLIAPDGKRGGVVATLRDISERRRNEATLRLAASVFDAAHEAIIIVDGAGRIVSVNGAFSRMSEYSAAEAVGQTLGVLAVDPASLYEQVRRALAADGVWEGELLARRKGGETYPLWASVSAVAAPDGRSVSYVCIGRDITGQKEENERIRYLAHYDGLTGLPNRTLFYDRARVEVLRGRREGGSFAVLYLDLDRFKWVNDTLGHAVGDALLVEVAHRLQDAVRESDTVSRFGGDEFVLLLSGVGVEDARALADKVLAMTGGEAQCLGHPLSITPSIGVAVSEAGYDDIDALLKQADAAMYAAKRSGRNAWRMATSPA